MIDFAVSSLLVAAAVAFTLFLATTLVAGGAETVAPPVPQFPPPPPSERPRLRLRSRLLFTRRTLTVICVDAVVVDVDEAPDGVGPTPGLPFALAVRIPDTSWFADRIAALLQEWADRDETVVLEVSADHGRLRTTMATHDSSVHLDLAHAAGLPPTLAA